MPNHQRGFSQILILLILMAGLVATVISVKQPKIFFSKAQSNKCKGTPTQQIAEDLGPSGKPGYAQNYNIYPGGCREKVGEEYLIGSPMANIAVDLGLQGKPGYAQNYNIFPDGKWEKDGEEYKIEDAKKLYGKDINLVLPPNRPEQDFEAESHYPPIPEVCKKIGSSKLIYREKTLPRKTDLPRFQTDLSKGIINAESPIFRLGLYVSNSGLPYKWDNAGEYPTSLGGEEPYWVMRVIRVSAGIGDGKNRWYWWGRKNGGLDLEDGCISILRLKKQQEEKGQPVPSYDELEELGMRLTG